MLVFNQIKNINMKIKYMFIADNWKDIERKYFEIQPDLLLLDLKMPEKNIKK